MDTLKIIFGLLVSLVLLFAWGSGLMLPALILIVVGLIFGVAVNGAYDRVSGKGGRRG